ASTVYSDLQSQRMGLVGAVDNPQNENATNIVEIMTEDQLAAIHDQFAIQTYVAMFGNLLTKEHAEQLLSRAKNLLNVYLRDVRISPEQHFAAMRILKRTEFGISSNEAPLQDRLKFDMKMKLLQRALAGEIQFGQMFRVWHDMDTNPLFSPVLKAVKFDLGEFGTVVHWMPDDRYANDSLAVSLRIIAIGAEVQSALSSASALAKIEDTMARELLYGMGLARYRPDLVIHYETFGARNMWDFAARQREGWQDAIDVEHFVYNPPVALRGGAYRDGSVNFIDIERIDRNVLRLILGNDPNTPSSLKVFVPTLHSDTNPGYTGLSSLQLSTWEKMRIAKLRQIAEMNLIYGRGWQRGQGAIDLLKITILMTPVGFVYDIYVLIHPDSTPAERVFAVLGIGLTGASGLAVLGRVGRAVHIPAPKGVETVQRAMSRAELESIQRTGMLSRGGRPGDHFVSPAVNANANRARQRLGLPRQPEVRVTLEVPAGTFTPPSTVRPFTLPDGRVLPGGGLERIAPGNLDIPVRIRSVDGF
ncbi:MAG: hypothetical protein IH991_00910, partial [Planctomycetes bacterium]|nr:hypothetical protein [Planctomycetota bacterium]